MSVSETDQHKQWKRLTGSIHSIVQRLDRRNVKETSLELIKLNIRRARGVLVRSLMQSLLTSPRQEIAVLASLASIINSQFPEIGQLLVSRLVVSFRKSYVSNSRKSVLGSSLFLTHLMNHQVCSDIVILQILQMALENPTNDSILLAVSIMFAGGQFLLKNSANASTMVFDKLRSFLQDTDVSFNSSSTQEIESLLRERRHNFNGHPPIPSDLDLVEDNDVETHTVLLDETIDTQDNLNSYCFAKNWEKEEESYREELSFILGNRQEVNVTQQDPDPEPSKTVDMTSSELINFQKTVYLTIMGSMSSDEAVHKLLKLNFMGSSGSTNEVLADMVIKCGSEEKTYSKYIGLIGEKLCSKNRRWQSVFVKLFKQYYVTIHQLNTNSVRNVGKLFGHLFACGILPIEDSWDTVTMTEEGTTSAGRIFIKFVFQEMVEELGIADLLLMVEADEVADRTQGMFPTRPRTAEDAEHVRFSINYFTAIGLGRLTERMRAALKQLEDVPRGRPRNRSSRGRSPSASRSYSRSRSGSYSRSRSGSYSRSESYSRSGSLRSRSRSADASDTQRRTSRSETRIEHSAGSSQSPEPAPYGMDPKRRRIL